MAKHRVSGDDQLIREGVTESPGAAYWSVDDSRWPAVRPDLPAHVVDLLAPPIVVGVARVPATSRLTPPAEHRSTPAVEPALAPPAGHRSAPAVEPRLAPPAEHRATSAAEPALAPPTGHRSTPAVEPALAPPTEHRPTTPAVEPRPGPAASGGLRKILPAGPGATSRRPSGAPTPAGRHRRSAGQPGRTA